MMNLCSREDTEQRVAYSTYVWCGFLLFATLLCAQLTLHTDKGWITPPFVSLLLQSLKEGFYAFVAIEMLTGLYKKLSHESAGTFFTTFTPLMFGLFQCCVVGTGIAWMISHHTLAGSGVTLRYLEQISALLLILLCWHAVSHAPFSAKRKQALKVGFVFYGAFACVFLLVNHPLTKL